MKHFIRPHKKINHRVLGSKDDRKICVKCKIEFNQKNFQIASTKIDPITQIIYKRLKHKCNNCENPLRTIRQNLEKDPNTSPKPNYCEHCYKKCKPVLHHNHKTGKFVRWACVNCNSRFTKDTYEEYINEGKLWYNEKK
mgnify:CR=1 FL=1|tara:strand:- start:87 stop:503 length:417 start_codon:yes stop_codon:yes gene_type:complete